MVVKVILIGLGLLVAFLGIRFFMLGQQSQGERPELGLVNEKLQICGEKPNCVSSNQATQDPHYIEPIAFSGSRLEASEIIHEIVTKEMNGELIEDKDGYLRYEVKTAVFQFVDDLEFYISDAINPAIQVRSASRVGYSDVGKNRQRVEKIRQTLAAKSGETLGE